MAFAKYDVSRRHLLQGAAVSVAALAGVNRAPSMAKVAAAQAGPVTLEFWNPATSPATSGLIVEMVDEFNKTVGAEQGIVVNNVIKENDPDYAPYTTAMTSSGSPDVVMTFAYDPVVSWAANGFIQPLDSFAEALGIEEDQFFSVAWRMINFGGHIWGLLQEFDFEQLWWNTDIYSGPAPKTIDELDALAEEYTLFDDAGNLTQAGFIPWLDSTDGKLWNTMWGGSFYDIDARKWTIDRPENRQFLEWFQKYVEMYGGRDKVDALDSSLPREYGDIFQYGVVAFAMEAEYLPGNLIEQGIELNYEIAHPPTANGVPYGTAVTNGGNVLVLPTNSGQPDAAAVFIQYMGDIDAVLAWCVANGNMPPIKSAAASPEFTEAWSILDPYTESLELGHMEPPNPSPVYPVFSELIGTAMDEVTYSGRSPEEALADVAVGVAEAVAQFQQTHPDWEGE